MQVPSRGCRLQNKEKEEAKANKEAKAAADSSTQASDAPALAAPSSPTPKPSPTQTLQTATAQRAQRFQKQYFSGSSSCSGAQTDGMRQLSSICSQLASPGKVQELLSMLQDQETANISTFEFLTSGAVQQLREYLVGSDLMKGKSKVHVDGQKLLQRLHAFWEAAMAQGKDGTPPMQSLVGITHSLSAVLIMHHFTLLNKFIIAGSRCHLANRAATSSYYRTLALLRQTSQHRLHVVFSQSAGVAYQDAVSAVCGTMTCGWWQFACLSSYTACKNV